ncbi:HET domain-containing protein [Aspergillus alliaceus]|uniref:HET domain-containing protein n=1 Tax=Petromyces alliaceus TaxID=209559 RepID=UPI0012A5AB78|nr:heterokaryon incompatibility protein-domain-containing protein [Aspergillus alliaceus]KAB8232389.1 heterokaryon incompatibility protein-domain-containing protein [Aspergillus alliaceus]
MSSYKYPPLPSGNVSTRMLRLLPHEDTNAQIQCELITYSLSKPGRGKHIYEALSYVWGKEKASRPIFTNGCEFAVTKNLYAALSHLRDHQLDRILWVDAVCIDQGNLEEKSEQIGLMRRIYAQANCVIVWLGKEEEGSDKAIERIRSAAGDVSLKPLPPKPDTNTIYPMLTKEEESSLRDKIEKEHAPIDHTECLNLLQRPWFRRIWVLQEVGVAKWISIMCGFAEINGYSFCAGLSNLEFSEGLIIPGQIRPVTNLMRRSIFRPPYTSELHGQFTLGELIDMYHTHEATKQHDKVYAILGLSTDETALSANYKLPWSSVFRQLVTYIFPGICDIKIRGTSVLEGRGCILGLIDSVTHHGIEHERQRVDVFFNNTAHASYYESSWSSRWELQASAKPIEKGDIVWLFSGALKPSIIRLSRDYFNVISIGVSPRLDSCEAGMSSVPDKNREATSPVNLHDISVIWNLEVTPNYPEAASGSELHPGSSAPGGSDSTQTAKRCDDNPALEEIAMMILNKPLGAGKAMESFLHHETSTFKIPERLVKAVAASTGEEAHLVMEALCKQRSTLPTTEEVVQAAAANPNRGHYIINVLFEYKGDGLPITEEVVKTAVTNPGRALEIIHIFCRLRGASLPVTEEVIMAAVSTPGHNAYYVMKALCRCRDDLPISREVLRAAGNQLEQGYKILRLLSDSGYDIYPPVR